LAQIFSAGLPPSHRAPWATVACPRRDRSIFFRNHRPWSESSIPDARPGIQPPGVECSTAPTRTFPPRGAEGPFACGFNRGRDIQLRTCPSAQALDREDRADHCAASDGRVLPMQSRSVSSSMNSSACRLRSLAIIAGFVRMLDTTVTTGPRR
jgi:hypothetical protein